MGIPFSQLPASAQAAVLASQRSRKPQPATVARTSKYHASPTVYNGVRYASAAEAARRIARVEQRCVSGYH
jgi:hypothetical protein